MIGSNSIDYKQTEKCIEEVDNIKLYYKTVEEAKKANLSTRFSEKINAQLQRKPFLELLAPWK